MTTASAPRPVDVPTPGGPEVAGSAVAGRYAEHRPVGAWAADLVCAWTSVTGAATTSTAPVVPDGCVDLLWSSTRGLVVVGPMTRPRHEPFPPGTSHVALRLRPGHAPRMLGVPASALTDLVVGAEAVLGDLGRRLDDRIGEEPGPEAQLTLLQRVPELVPAAEVDRLALGALDWLVSRPDRRIRDAADQVGMSERQLHRRVVTAVGYGPKRFQRVVRTQRALAAGPARLGDLARLAAELGFADHAHLTRELRELTGRPAHQALLDARATLTSEPFKRGAP